MHYIPTTDAPLTLNPLLNNCEDPIAATGGDTLAAILALAEQALMQLRQSRDDADRSIVGPQRPPSPAAAVARLRGTGPGVSFQRMIDRLEADHPVEMVYPFEANERVGGAIWPGTLADPSSPNALMKLRWERHADDLPLHIHKYSDRFIIVLKGKGFFHLADTPCDTSLHPYDPGKVRTIAARERDAFIFTRGATHTFSTFDEPMELISCHLPYIPIDDPAQYTLPPYRWTAGEQLQISPLHAIALNGWSIFA